MKSEMYNQQICDSESNLIYSQNENLLQIHNDIAIQNIHFKPIQ